MIIQKYDGDNGPYSKDTIKCEFLRREAISKDSFVCPSVRIWNKTFDLNIPKYMLYKQ